MLVKEAIDKSWKIHKKILAAEEQLKFYDVKASSANGPVYDQERIDKTRNLDAPFIYWINKRMDLEKKIEEDKLELEKLSNCLCSSFDEGLDDNERLVLLYRHTLFMEFKEISDATNYALSHVYRLATSGMKKLENKQIPDMIVDES